MARKLRIAERLSGICSKYSPLSIKVPTCTPWDILCGGPPCSDIPSKAQRKGKPPGQCRKRRAARYTYTQTTHLSVKLNPPGSASTTGFWSPCAWSLSRLPGGVRTLASRCGNVNMRMVPSLASCGCAGHKNAPTAWPAIGAQEVRYAFSSNLRL